MAGYCEGMEYRYLPHEQLRVLVAAAVLSSELIASHLDCRPEIDRDVERCQAALKLADILLAEADADV